MTGESSSVVEPGEIERGVAPRLREAGLALAAALGAVWFSIAGSASIIWWFRDTYRDSFTARGVTYDVMNLRWGWLGWGEWFLFLGVALPLAALTGLLVSRGSRAVRIHLACFLVFAFAGAIHADRTFNYRDFGSDLPAFISGPSVLWTFFALGCASTLIAGRLALAGFVRRRTGARGGRLVLGSVAIATFAAWMMWYGLLPRESIS